MILEPHKIIKFYRVGDDYGWMSNFAPYQIKVSGVVWPTSEHYFQAQKFRGTVHEKLICSLASPMEAANYGRRRDIPLREDWDIHKNHVMRTAVRSKFRQHEEIRSKLLATQNAILVEHTRNDSYWADGGDGSGKNMLGQILMGVREELSQPATSKSWEGIPMPKKRASIHLAETFTAEEFSTIRLGLIPEEMEDKWFIYWEEPWLHIHHSWTKHEIFRVRIEQESAATFAVQEVHANRDVQQYSRTDDVHDATVLRWLIRGLLLGDLATVEK